MKKHPLQILLIVTLAVFSLAVTMPGLGRQSVSQQLLAQQTSAYTPKFPGDPARSDSEAAALAYMRVVLRAQHRFQKQSGHFAVTLAELVHSGSFTKRMVDPNRGDWNAEIVKYIS